NLRGERLTNTGVAFLGGMKRMGELSLRDTKLTSLEPIRMLTSLEFLDLTGSPIDDVGLRPAAGFLNLESIQLGRTSVTDAGMVHICRLPRLKALKLDRTVVSAAGISRLCDLPSLSYLNVYQTEVTDHGLADLAGKLSHSSCSSLVVAGPRLLARAKDEL